MAKVNKHIKSLLADEAVISKIYFIREQKIMLDRDLAEMYGVDTKRLKEAVRRNIDRFPPDLFELTIEEYNALRSQFATLKRGKHTKYLPLHLPSKAYPCFPVYSIAQLQFRCTFKSSGYFLR